MIPYENIRLIVSDVDGTLLQDGSKPLDRHLFDLIRRIQKLGVRFVVASGRQYPNLQRLFAPLSEEITFAPENGAVMLYKGELLRKVTIEREIALEMIADIQKDERCQVVASGTMTTYIHKKDRKAALHMLFYYGNTVTVVDDFAAIPEEFVKIAALTPIELTHQITGEFRTRWAGRFPVMVAGDEWMDFGHTGKGEAIRFLMDEMGLNPSQVMVFGDNFNDEGMMRLAGYPWAMRSSDEYLRQLCGRSCETVACVLEEFLAACEKG